MRPASYSNASETITGHRCHCVLGAIPQRQVSRMGRLPFSGLDRFFRVHDGFFTMIVRLLNMSLESPSDLGKEWMSKEGLVNRLSLKWALARKLGGNRGCQAQSYSNYHQARRAAANRLTSKQYLRRKTLWRPLTNVTSHASVQQALGHDPTRAVKKVPTCPK
jgi:hypothetical protein